MTLDKIKTTLQDVARQAGVSLATASRVFNNTAPVSEEVRQRVLASAASLGYHSPAPRESSVMRQKGIALLLPDIINPYFTEIVRGAQDEADFSRFIPILLDSAEDPQLEKRFLQMLISQAVCGIIVLGTRVPKDELASILSQINTPTVVINACIRLPNVSCIVTELEKATYRAVHHLLDLGHKRIAFLAGPGTSETSKTRRRGIEKALGEAGLCLPDELCPSSFPNIDGGFQSMSAVLALPESRRPTAVIAHNDLMALGVLHAARMNHLRVPEDLSVIGIDNISMAEHSNPPLTTIAPPKHRIGRMAMQLLQHMIDGDFLPEEGYTYVDCPLIVRESTSHVANGK